MLFQADLSNDNSSKQERPLTSDKSMWRRSRLLAPGSKQAQVVEMLCKDNGASLDALVKATSRLPHTTRAALTGLRKRGYAVEWVLGESKDSLYRIVERPEAAAGA